MKVLNEGKKWSIKHYCLGIGINGGGCGAVLEVEAEDIYAIPILKDEETPDFMYSKQDFCYTFKCPCCNIETDINASKLPTTVKRRALQNLRVSVKEIRLDVNGRMYL